MVVAADLIHDDYAYIFEAYWDLWTPNEQGEWLLVPSLVTFTAQGEEFEEGAEEETGHIQIDFGLDSLFVQEQVKLTEETQGGIGEKVVGLLGVRREIEVEQP